MPFKIYPFNLVICLAIFLPNLLMLFFPPVNVPQQKNENWIWNVVVVLERIGQVSLFILPLFWKIRTSDRKITYILIAMALLLLLYYAIWTRYLLNKCQFASMFQSLFYIPIPLALAPIVYFALAGILLESWPVIIAAVIFALGHIPESLRNLALSQIPIK
ncbi:MAG: hypothetical protein Q8920_10155 [Bacillota bacterium]|nr:hypothetical protein [Bacillota bacterium]